MARIAAGYVQGMAALRCLYARELPAKAGDVTDAAARVAARWDPAGREKLYRLAHRLAGSAAIFGFPGVSQAAAALEAYVASASPKGSPPVSKRRPRLKVLSDALRRAFLEESGRGQPSP